MTELAEAHSSKVTISTLLAMEKRLPIVCRCRPTNHKLADPSTAGGAKKITAACNAQT